jgi:hypothetical protein
MHFFTKRNILAFSVALHLVVLGLLFVSLPKFSPTPEYAVYVDLPEPAAASIVETSSAKRGSGKLGGSVMKASGAKSIPLSALAPSWKPSMNGPSLGSADSEDSWGTQSSESIVKPKSSAAMAWVYKKTDQVLGYPMAFTKHEIQGSVNAHISFDAQGRFDLSHLDVTSDSPYLKVYVYRLLEKTFFADPVPPSFRNWKDRLNVDAQIRFTFVESGIKLELVHKIAGNKIYFAKNHPQSKLQWKLGPLSGMGAAVGLDVLWFARKAKEATSNSVPVDDLEEYENDTLFN